MGTALGQSLLNTMILIISYNNQDYEIVTKEETISCNYGYLHRFLDHYKLRRHLESFYNGICIYRAIPYKNSDPYFG